MKPTIMIVEDEEIIRSSIRLTLENEGYGVSEGADIAGLREALRGSPPAALILDLSLPDGNALEVLPQIKAQWPATRIVILTGYGTVEVAEQAYKVDDQIILQSKPFDSEMLKALLGLVFRTDGRGD